MNDLFQLNAIASRSTSLKLLMLYYVLILTFCRSNSHVPLFKTDHFQLELDIVYKPSRNVIKNNTHKPRKVYLFNKVNIDELRYHLSDIDFIDIIENNIDDINKAWEA